MFTTPLALARIMFAVMAVVFALSVVTRNPFLIFYGALGFALAGQVMTDTGQGTKQRR